MADCAQPLLQTLVRLEEQDLATERLLAQHRASIEQLLDEHRRTLAEHRRAVELTLQLDYRTLVRRVPAPLALPARPEPPHPLVLSASHTALMSNDNSDTCSESASSHSEERTPRSAVKKLVRGQTGTVGDSIKPENCLQRVILPITESEPFQAFIALLVVINAILLALGVDMNIKHILYGENNPWLPFIDNVQNAILVVFVIEIVMRILAEQCSFLSGPQWKWNIFETLLVGTNIIDVMSSHTAGGFSALRLVRIMRIFRAVRIIRVFGFLRQLRLMIFSIIASLVSLVWALLLMAVLIFVAAIYLEEISYQYLNDVTQSKDDHIAEMLRTYWGGMYHAIYSLIFSVSGGKDWGDVAEPFLLMSTADGAVYTAIVLFITFGFFNVVIGIFLTETGDIGELDRDLVLQNAARKSAAMMDNIRLIFNEIDTDGDGLLTCEEIKEAVTQNETISAHLSHFEIDVPPTKVDMFCQLMDHDSDGVVSVQEFVHTCLRLQGSAKPMDVAMLMIQQDNMQRTIESVASTVSKHEAGPAAGHGHHGHHGHAHHGHHSNGVSKHS